MARKPRIHFAGAVYHVMLRGNAGQDIFLDDEDRSKMLLSLQKCVERFHCRIHAFCLMSNHIHLVAQVGEISLSRIMQSMNLQYTRHYNRKNGISGHVFQGRFKAILIDADSYLLQLARYIHLNPVRASIVKSPEEYQWSSHNIYCGTNKLPWITSDWLLSLFSENHNQAVSQYKTFVEDGIAEEYRKEFHKGNQEGRLLGDDDFAEKVFCKCGRGSQRRVSIDDVIACVCSDYAICPEDLTRPGKQRSLSEARIMAAWLIREHAHLSLTEYGCRVNRDISNLSNGICRMLKRAETDRVLADRMYDIKGRLESP